jgi:hypothetical protein
MSTQEQTTKPAAETPQPAPTIAPETVIERLRDLRAQIGEVNELTPEQRRALARRLRTPGPVVQASIDVMGALETVSQAIGQPTGEVRQMVDEASRWTSVENELRAMLNGVAGANLLRRQRIEFVAAQAAVIGSRLALDPAHKVLVPHVQEVKRLKRFLRRKKAAQAPETPQTPPPASTPAPTPSGGAKTEK